MRTCPKCGNYRISGPMYEKDEGGERLTYRCTQCGYVESGPTDDQLRRRAERQPQQPNPKHGGTYEQPDDDTCAGKRSV